MSPGTRRCLVALATLTLATTVLSGPAVGASPAAGEAAKPDLFGTTYPDRFKAPKKTGGTVIIADWQEANLFNPYYTDNVTEADIATATNASLITSTDDFRYYPDLSTDPLPTVDNGGVKVPGDGTDAMTVTWVLRDGLKWSDGTPLTCDDFVYTLDWHTDPSNAGIPEGQSGYLTDAYLKSLADASNAGTASPPLTDADRNLSIECASATQMIWHYKNIDEGYLGRVPYIFQRAYNSQFAVADMVTGKGWSAADVTAAPISGPFKFGSITPGQQVDLVRNDNYVDHLTGKPAFLDKAIVKWYGSADAMIAAYAGGQPEYDVSKDLNDADLPKLEGLKNVVQLTSLTYEMLRPNWDPKHCSLVLQPIRGGYCIMSDPAVRKALSLILDRDTINKRALGGTAAPAYTNTSPNAWFYKDIPGVGAPPDIDAANKVLDDAGWVTNPDTGFRFKDVDGDGKQDNAKGDYDARIEACTTTRAYRQDLLALVSQMMNQIGFAVVISPVSSVNVFAAYNESTDQTPCAVDRGNADLWEHGFSVPLDPIGNFPVYHSTQVPPNGQNSASVNDPAIDKALETVKSSVDFAVVMDAMGDFQQLFVDDSIETPIFFRKEVYLQNPKLQNFTGNPTSTGPLWNIQHWWKKGGK